MKNRRHLLLRVASLATLGGLATVPRAAANYVTAASDVSFLQSGKGAITGPVQSKLSEFVSLADFGAKGDALTDNGPMLQAAHDTLSAGGGAIFIPPTAANWRIDTPVVFTKPVRLFGAGWPGSTIVTTMSGIVVLSSSNRLLVEDLGFTTVGAAAGTATFIFQPSTSNYNNYSTIRNCYFINGNYAYHSQRAISTVVENNLFATEGTASLYFEDLINSDEGDCFVRGNTFSNGASVVGIIVGSISSLIITNNKFLSETGHILISPNLGNVGDYIISDNSFEGQTSYAISLGGSASYVVTKTQIVGNQFSSASTAHIIIGNNVLNTIISSNIFNNISATTGIGVNIAGTTGVNDVTITGNEFYNILTAVNIYNDGNVSPGLTMTGNRFANDVKTAIIGDIGLNLLAGNKEITLTKFVTNASDTVYVDVFKFKSTFGAVLEIKIYGAVQGAGHSNYYRRLAFMGTTINDIDGALAQGTQFDTQVAASGSYVVVRVKRHTGVGSALTVYCEVKATGHVAEASLGP